jgi:hypothetical protein
MSADNENTNFLWGHSSLQRNFRKNLIDTDFVNVGRKIKTVQVVTGHFTQEQLDQVSKLSNSEIKRAKE